MQVNLFFKLARNSPRLTHATVLPLALVLPLAMTLQQSIRPATIGTTITDTTITDTTITDTTITDTTTDSTTFISMLVHLLLHLLIESPCRDEFDGFRKGVLVR